MQLFSRAPDTKKRAACSTHHLQVANEPFNRKSCVVNRESRIVNVEAQIT